MRVTVDDRCEITGYKIRAAQMEKIPYMLVVGDKEQEEKTLSVRKRGQGDLGAMSVNDFISSALDDISTRKIW